MISVLSSFILSLLQAIQSLADSAQDWMSCNNHRTAHSTQRGAMVSNRLNPRQQSCCFIISDRGCVFCVNNTELKPEPGGWSVGQYLRGNGFETMWLHTTLRMRPERYFLHTATYIIAVLHDEMVVLFLTGQSPSQSFNFLSSFAVTCSSIAVIRIMGSFS